jgi:hypothetical protein
MSIRRPFIHVAVAAVLLAACDDRGITDPESAIRIAEPGGGPRFSGSVAPDPVPRLYANGDHWLGWAPRRAFTTAEWVSADSVKAYLRIGDDAWQRYNAFYDGVVDDSLVAWAQDSRLNLNPNFVAALLVIESGFNPHTFEAGGFTYGYAQMGPTSDNDMIQQIDNHAGFQWMKPQVHPDYAATNGYARSPAQPADSAQLSQWYLADPLKATRAMVYVLKQLENLWTGVHKVPWGNGNHSWWRTSSSRAAAYPADTSYAELARRIYGRAPNEGELLDLVAASYNRGYPWVEQMLITHGTGWSQYLRTLNRTGPCLTPPAQRDSLAKEREASCYLDRARHYTVLFQQGAVSVSTDHEVLDDFDQDATLRWSTYQGTGSTLTRSVPPSWDAYLGTAVDSGLGLLVQYSIGSGSYGGVGRWYSTAQNWKTRAGIGDTEGIGFWYYGNGRDVNGGAGVVVTVELQDNRSTDPLLNGVDTAERWVWSFRDNFVGWRYVDIPWSAFTRGSWQPHAATPNDGLTLTSVWGLAVSPQSGTRWFRLDQLRLTEDRPWTP